MLRHNVRFDRAVARVFGGAACLMFAVSGCVATPATNDSTGGTGGSGGTNGSGGSGAKPSGAGSGNTGFACTSDASPGEMVDVPAGDFLMGCDPDKDEQCEDDEMPQHTVTLSAFSIDVTEVTQDAYAACVGAGACDPPKCDWDCDHGDYPASCVDWTMASTYCAWADKRLPTEAEWEKAARGTKGQKYPWGDQDPDCTLANMDGCGGAALPVGSLKDGKSPYGALDMAGNMVELVADVYDAKYYAGSPDTDPTGPAMGDRYGGRGGGWKSVVVWQRSAKRDWYNLDDQGGALGFRCAR